ncbi:hypothetical protein MRQ36_22185 [Micromonospora sp. R77]|uniref:hypothetical protein n=1 Tax=Micromonospora sp. R77 TaxID=2925836 RepID=UPI001F60EB69|nr:hypothetical protein [Micromonospora sp. R77]MCI4065126.1 hypothetical protein [Micromonospora sp. R77]
MRTRRPLLVAVIGAAAVLLLAVVGCAWAGFRLVGDDRTETRACQDSVTAAAAKVRTDRWDPPGELPDLGDYPEIHWQVRTQGNPCSRAPGPTDRAYQGVVTLRPEDARALAERYDFVPLAAGNPNGPADLWPALVPFLPSGSRWLHSRSYDETAPSTRWRTAFLDVEHRTLVFMLNDH